jgi:hypothetical protein
LFVFFITDLLNTRLYDEEDFLHYLWKFKIRYLNLKTSNNEEITIVNVGQYLELAGPDFSIQVTIGDQMWAGNVEIHLKSSDWYVHHHEGIQHTKM